MFNDFNAVMQSVIDTSEWIKSKSNKESKSFYLYRGVKLQRPFRENDDSAVRGGGSVAAGVSKVKLVKKKGRETMTDEIETSR